MRGHIFENAVKSSDPKRIVSGYRDMMLSARFGRVTHVRATLAGETVAKNLQGLGQFTTGDITR